MNVSVNIDAVLGGIDAMQEHLENPKPVLREWARKSYIPSVKATLAAGGKGSKPYAESTLAARAARGTSQITKHGKLRSDRVKRGASAIKRNAKALERDGWSPDWQRKQDRLQKNLARSEAAERKHAENKATAARLRKEAATFAVPTRKESKQLDRDRARAEKLANSSIGKRQSEKNSHPLEKMPKTIRASIKDDTVVIYSATADVGAAQDEGAGPGGGKKSTTPDRPYIVTPDFDQQIERLGDMFAGATVEAFDG